MTEVVFPLLGAAFVMWGVLPASALCGKLALLGLDRIGGPLRFPNLRYVLLAGSTTLPLSWFFSASLHQAESGRSELACILEHHEASRCFEPHLFALTLAAGVLLRSAGLLRHARQARPRFSMNAELRGRIDRLLRLQSGLQALRGRVVLTDVPGFALGTHGWLSPRVYVGVTFARDLTDEMLAGALAHEGAHVRAWDPLRYLLLQLSMVINPFGRRIMGAHVVHWITAREAQCDREAVARGSQPLSLAEAIIHASRPMCASHAALGTGDTSVLRFRVEMLIAFAEQRPNRATDRLSAFPLTVALVWFALLLPHQSSTVLLDIVHIGAEHTLTPFLR